MALDHVGEATIAYTHLNRDTDLLHSLPLHCLSKPSPKFIHITWTQSLQKSQKAPQYNSRVFKFAENHRQPVLSN